MFIFPRSSMVERIPVKNKVVGSNPTEGALRQAQCEHLLSEDGGCDGFRTLVE